ncbi:AbrB/MazE/SpoVT family DNA-binding domain-containing protein [Candidatus Bathyarchaeota archaeon]|nr:AbrB/MazE/SpoVT family DNA-binding domain-containing protein [Candidatus Bathyarchaeota archaeon]
MSEEARIGRRWTLVIPKEIRERAGLREGQGVLLRVEGGRIVIQPLPIDPFKVLEEAVGEPYVEAEDEVRAERWLAEHARG